MDFNLLVQLEGPHYKMGKVGSCHRPSHYTHWCYAFNLLEHFQNVSVICIHTFYCLLQEVPNIYIKIKNCEVRMVLYSASESS
jgi:hypothetical protein